MQTARQYEVKPPNEEETVLLTRNPFLDEYVRYEKLGVAEIHKCGFVIGKSNTLDIHHQHVHQPLIIKPCDSCDKQSIGGLYGIKSCSRF